LRIVNKPEPVPVFIMMDEEEMIDIVKFMRSQEEDATAYYEDFGAMVSLLQELEEEIVQRGIELE
jgi:hypothetical protein